MSKQIIIFGAGENGKILYKYFGKEKVYCFCDNKISGGCICSFKDLKKLYKADKHEIILSTDSDEIRQQLQSAGMEYWEFVRRDNNYFSRREIVNDLDRKLYMHYISQSEYSGEITRLSNWFREDIKSEKTGKLISAMRSNDISCLNKLYNETYHDNVILFDEFYDTRPGMRLLANIIKEYHGAKVCDIACGHGMFVKHLSDLGFNCFASDVSEMRCKHLENSNITCMVGTAEDTDWESDYFDFVTLQECLEHVVNPFLVVKETYRIVKKNGIIAITVPYYDNCSSENHVRLFLENDLYSLAKAFGCRQIKIMKIPYLNWSIEGLKADSLLMTCVK